MVDAPRPTNVRARPLTDLLDRLPGARLHGPGSTAAGGIPHAPRAARRGGLDLARAGEHPHGIAPVAQALAAGAPAVLTDAPSVETAVAAGATPVVAVDAPRAATGPAAAWVYDE